MQLGIRAHLDSVQTSWPFCPYIPRNPFISRRRSLDVAETIRYTWNQLARSAGKWVKGLTAPKRQGERERERERKKDAESLQFEKWLYHCVVHLPFSVSFFFCHAHRSLSPFRISAIRCISVSIFISTFHPIFCPFRSSVFPHAYVCLSSLFCLFQLMEAHTRRLNAVRRCNLTVLLRRETATKSR